MDLDLHLDGIRAGDPEAFGRWAAGAERPLRESLRSFAAAVDTEAVLQETLLRVWQVAPRFEGDGRGNALLRFALRCGRNLAVSETRRLRTRPGAPGGHLDAGAGEGPGDAPQVPVEPDPYLREALLRCRDELPGKPAAALGARLESGGGAPDATLAERLGMTLNTFLQNVTRARRLLETCLRGRGILLSTELP